MTTPLSQALQEVEDARRKGLLSEIEAASQREAVLSRHAGSVQPVAQQMPPIVATSTQNRTVYYFGNYRRRCCCSARGCARFFHGIQIAMALIVTGMAITATQIYTADVWINCDGPNAFELNQSHPIFCEYHHHSHHDHDDDEDYNEWVCGNEKWEFRFGGVTYEKKDFREEHSWSSIASYHGSQIFEASIGTFYGDSHIFTQSHHQTRKLKAVGITFEVLALVGLVVMIVATRRTFKSTPSVERPRRWCGIAGIYFVITAFAITMLALSSSLAPVARDHDDHDHDHDETAQLSEFWSEFYPDQYGCYGSPTIPSVGFAITALTLSLWIIILAVLRICCIRGKPFNLDSQTVADSAPLAAFVGVDPVAPSPYTAYPPGIHSGVVPPPYPTGVSVSAASINQPPPYKGNYYSAEKSDSFA